MNLKPLLSSAPFLLVALSSAQLVTATSSANRFGTVKDSGPSSAAVSRAANDGAAAREGFVAAKMGEIHAYSHVVTTTLEASNAHFHFSTGKWSDMVTIDAPGLTGQTGTVTVGFRVNGSIGATGGFENGNFESLGQARAVLTVRDGGLSFFDSYRPITGYTSNVAGGFLNRSWTHTATFTFGTPFELAFELGANATAYSKFSVSTATADLGHTAYWEGFKGLAGPNGELTNYTVSSLSGTNWAQPVPEPASVAALSLSALAVLRRRK